ncbi:redoxin domain-containing protein [Flagellimonas sp. S3867]|uniref:TlpA family protein disulfide reductase n=1 Tax=Flagellimonas sp. S3867 TaxID=2768063 RepID=UPI0016891730|nr:redoxin domain-containing protein [Flagellimonas sp. S3867]
MTRLLLSLSLLSVLACSTKSRECPSVFFGGEIVNPTSDYVVLYKNDSYIDSVKLDKGNRFAFNLQGIEEGLYHFDHNPELQYLYLQEGDSIIVRLNTKEFDESLVFSGRGSEVNNFLIEMFLAHEEEEPLIYDYYALEPESFDQKMDSLRTEKIAHLKDLEEHYVLSEKVSSVAMASIDYTNYTYKEKYPFKHKWKKGIKSIPELPANFYEYRKSVDLNNGDLTYFRPYLDYLKYHFGNLAYASCMKYCNMQEDSAYDYLHFNNHTLKLVDSLVQQDDLRNILFRNVAMAYLLREHSPSEECQSFIDKFSSLSTSDKHEKEIAELYEGIQRLQPENDLPNLFVTDTDNQKVSLKDISREKKTVFYFWSASQKGHFRNVHKRISKLQQKYPDYNFVGINVKTGYPQWRSMVEEHGLDAANQYHGGDFKEVQMAMIIDNLNKCVISKDTVVVDAFANLYTSL